MRRFLSFRLMGAGGSIPQRGISSAEAALHRLPREAGATDRVTPVPTHQSRRSDENPKDSIPARQKALHDHATFCRVEGAEGEEPRGERDWA
jgi:hypothetical protein